MVWVCSQRAQGPGMPSSRAPIAEELRQRVEPAGSSQTRWVFAALGVVVLVFVSLTMSVALETPAWENADEPGHVQNVESLVRGHWYGMAVPCTPPGLRTSRLETTPTPTCQGNEAEQPPLYYLMMAAWQDILGVPAHTVPQNLGVTFGLGGGHFTSHPDRNFLLWLRYANVLLGAVTVVTTFFVAKEVARERWTPVIAAAIVAFMPRFVFLSAFVTNDNLANLLGAVLALCALRYIRRAKVRWIIATGGVFGLLVTTKLSALPLGLLLPVLALSAPTTWRRRLVQLTWALGSALVVSAWYLIQNWDRYGDPLAGHVSNRYELLVGGLGTSLLTPYVVTDPFRLVFLDVPRRLLATYWFESGWMRYHWPTWVGIAITLVVIAAIIGLVGQRISKRVLLALGTIAVLSLLSVWVVSFETATYQFRLALIGLPATGALLALALQRWPATVRLCLPLAGLVGCLTAIHAYVLDVHWT